MFGEEVPSIATVDEHGYLINIQYVSEEDLAAYLRERLLDPESRFKLAAQTGIPELAYLDRLRPSDASLPLSEVSDLYFNKRKKKITKNTRRDNERYWKEFVDLIGVERITEITAEHIRNYHDTIYDQYERHDRSPDFVSHKFGAVKTILNNATKHGRDLDELHRVLTICRMLQPPDKDDENPQPIERKHYHKLLKAADSLSDCRAKAILLVMLNACMKPEAVRTLWKDEVDLAKGTLVTRRKKKGKVIRAAVLWKRTIQAIRKYQKEHAHEAETLFANDNGDTFGGSSQAIRKIFNKLRDKAGLPNTVKAEHVRDGAYTAASADEKEEDLGKSRILAGHDVGISDKYIRRHPEIVTGVCRQVEKAYFASKKK
jgi:integrase